MIFSSSNNIFASSSSPMQVINPIQSQVSAIPENPIVPMDVENSLHAANTLNLSQKIKEPSNIQVMANIGGPQNNRLEIHTKIEIISRCFMHPQTSRENPPFTPLTFILEPPKDYKDPIPEPMRIQKVYLKTPKMPVALRTITPLASSFHALDWNKSYEELSIIKGQWTTFSIALPPKVLSTLNRYPITVMHTLGTKLQDREKLVHITQAQTPNCWLVRVLLSNTENPTVKCDHPSRVVSDVVKLCEKPLTIKIQFSAKRISAPSALNHGEKKSVEIFASPTPSSPTPSSPSPTRIVPTPTPNSPSPTPNLPLIPQPIFPALLKPAVPMHLEHQEASRLMQAPKQIPSPVVTAFLPVNKTAPSPKTPSKENVQINSESLVKKTAKISDRLRDLQRDKDLMNKFIADGKANPDLLKECSERIKQIEDQMRTEHQKLNDLYSNKKQKIS